MASSSPSVPPPRLEVRRLRGDALALSVAGAPLSVLRAVVHARWHDPATGDLRTAELSAGGAELEALIGAPDRTRPRLRRDPLRLEWDGAGPAGAERTLVARLEGGGAPPLWLEPVALDAWRSALELARGGLADEVRPHRRKVRALLRRLGRPVAGPSGRPLQSGALARELRRAAGELLAGR